MTKLVFRLGQAKYKIANELKWGVTSGETPDEGKISEIVGYIAIGSFIIGIVSIYIFIFKVIL